MAAISRLGYLGFEVSDVAAWERFAVDALGLLVSQRRSDGSVAFRIDDQAQRIVVHPGSRDDLAYAGFEVDDEATLRRLSEALTQAGFPTSDAGDDIARARRVKRVLRGVRAVDLLFEASGGRGLFLDNPMQRYFRDVHAMRAHALNNPDRASQVFGYAELHPGGTPPEFFL